MATVHEPRRRGLIAGNARWSDGKPKAVPIREIRRFVGNEWKTFVPIFIAMGIKTMLVFGTTGWMFEFFIRAPTAGPRRKSPTGQGVIIAGPFAARTAGRELARRAVREERL